MSDYIKDGVIYESAEDDQTVIDPTENDPAPILPDGWDGEGDFLDDASWPAGDASANAEPAPEDDPAEPVTEPDEDDPAPTTGDGDSAGEELGTTEPRKLKFTATVDHNNVDVEVDEGDLPTLYQKAQVVDRVQGQLSKQKGTIERANLLAKGMGFETADEMLAAAQKNYRDAEIARLVEDPEHPVHPDVAADIIDRRLGYTPAPSAAAEPEPAPAPAPQGAERDFRAEVAELTAARPELVGKELPEEVVATAVAGKRLVDAYRDYEERQTKAVNSKLQKENKILKHNADTAAHAPVSGVTGGGAPDTSPADPFLDGFNSNAW